MDIDEKINKWKSFDMASIINRAVKKHETQILSWNTEDQLYLKGIRSTGESIEPPYRPRTIQIKRTEREPPQPVDRVTLRDTGRFHESFNIKYLDNMVVISSENILKRTLISKYGNMIFGLTDEHVEMLKELIYPDIIEEIRQWA